MGTNEDHVVLAGGDIGASQRLNTIQAELFTRPSESFDKRGTSGTPIDIVANFVPISQEPDHFVTQYHVEYIPQVDSKAYRHEILKQDVVKSRIGSAFIFDGMILYVVSDQNFHGEYAAVHPNTGEPVTVRLTASVKFSQFDAQTINCYNIVIGYCLDTIGLKRLGRNRFDESEKARLHGYEMEVWPGFETSVRHYEDQLMLCVENRFKMIRTQSVLEIILQENQRLRMNDIRFRTFLDNLLIGQTVFAKYNNKMYRITSIEYEMNAQSSFTLSSGAAITLRGYFEQQYNLTLTTDEQPVLVSEGKPKQPGEAPQKSYLLPELVYPTGLTDAMRRDNRQMKELSRHTRLDPERRRVKTECLLRKVLENPECNSLLQNWGISLHYQLVSFQSRELEPEVLYGLRRDGYTAERAEWARHVRSNGNFRGVDLINWIVVTPRTDEGRYFAEEFIHEIGNIYDAMRLGHSLPMVEYCAELSAVGYEEAIRTAIDRARNQPIHMIVVILSDDSKGRYDRIKTILCKQTTIPSQFVRLSTLRGNNRPGERGRSKNFVSIVLKIALQINCKMGGALWKVKIPMKRAMIVGYDLYHDSTLHGKTIGACVSTMDQEYTKFYSQTQPHDNPTELGTNLAIFIRRALQHYFKENGNTLPDKIFLYRDGVGDGQIRIVKEEEVKLVQQACADAVERARLRSDIPTDFKIKLAFIIVTKKVNMRIFKGSYDSQLTNPNPGTVVDSVITRPERYDFYLVPQYVNQGTVTPVCYNIIYDDTGLPPDKHHRLAYKLCHLYYNWQGTVRVPAPCQYAHKLAFLIAQSIHSEATEPLRNKLFFL